MDLQGLTLDMDLGKHYLCSNPPPVTVGSVNFVNKVQAKVQLQDHEKPADYDASMDVDVDLSEIYFLILHFLSSGPCQKTFQQLCTEILEHKLLPRRYHAWHSRNGLGCMENDNGNSFPLSYDNLVARYPHIRKDHLVRLLKQLMLMTSPPLRCMVGKTVPSAADVPTLLGTGSFSLFSSDKNRGNNLVKRSQHYFRWPHEQVDSVRGLRLREIGGGFPRHHRAPSIRLACYTIAKPSSVVLKMQNMKKLRGHRDAVYCAIFDRSGRYVITGSDDRLVKIWSMETAFCLASCRGHEGDITDLSVSSNNAAVASASNDFTIRVWRLPDGYPISILRGHTGVVTAIAFSPSPRPNAFYQLLSSSDDGTCRVWDARYSHSRPRVYIPKPTDDAVGMASNLPSASAPPSTASQCHQILCCAYNANGTVFVTGSSDTLARVWSACKRIDEPDQPIHEIDTLTGHGSDVNYVQFSGCAVASRSSPSDSFTKDGIPKFKNSWFNHDSIVTCSHDGSAIIWAPKSRGSHGKVGRWVRAYHLKVPPPPMPPRPTRGGPRQRFVPTPRGVNMIIWSLDNRFVLAAIMDNRICVWNANDGSLVHSLAGHTASAYVLDVHPFNPRIAMSAGYDGKAILWDIWEGTPIRVFDIGGRFKLVDGKFSQDGTSIVLSDDVGQIYLLNTGEGESHKDAKYDQFFLGDYRLLIQDTHGNVVDEETQLAPYMRNMQDRLCDSSMLPYPEPYQTMYQCRRLGALGIEWRPSSIKFAVGTDISIGQDIQILPLPDLDVVFEPLPDYADAMFWEPENDGMNDDNDSEYNVNEEFFSDGQTNSSYSTKIDSECSEDNARQSQKDSTRRTKRKKPVLEVELTTSAGRRAKKRNKDEKEATSSRGRKHRNAKSIQRSSRNKSSKLKSLRPRRVAAHNAVNNFSQIIETSADEDEESSAGETSDGDLSLGCSSIKRKEYSDNSAATRAFSDGSEEIIRPLTLSNSQINGGNKKKLVVRFSLHHHSTFSDNHVGQVNDQASASSTLRAREENSEENRVNSRSGDLASSSASIAAIENTVSYERLSEDIEKTTEASNAMSSSTTCGDTNARWRKLKIRMPNISRLGDAMPTDAGAESTNKLLPTEGDSKSSLSIIVPLPSDLENSCPAVSKTHHFGAAKDLSSSDIGGCSNFIVDEKLTSRLNHNSEKKITVIKIKSKKFPLDPTSKLLSETSSDAFTGAAGELTAERSHFVVENPVSRTSLAGNSPDVVDGMLHLYDNTNGVCESGLHVSLHNQEAEAELPDIATDSARRDRSSKLDALTWQFGIAGYDLDRAADYLKPSTSIGPAVNMLEKAVDDSLLEYTGIPRSPRSERECYDSQPRSSLVGKNKYNMPKKSNWLLLSEQEEGYRYIPQLGDEVLYLRQGHQDYIDLSQSSLPGPWVRYGDKIRAIEVCLVEDLKYTTHSGSGESCCQITLKLIDTSCNLVGQKFRLMLPELDDFPDFIVERTWYDAAMDRNWSTRDKCLVWWRDDSGQGGAWWEGRITAIKDKSSDFPGSPWERYLVKYKNDDTDFHCHCPWELHDSDISWEKPTLDFKRKAKILKSLTKLLQRARKDKDRYGIKKLNEVSEKLEFMNRFPVPLSLSIIKSRIENDYYRSLTAMKHDVEVMLSNAESYFQKKSELLRKMKRMASWFDDILSDL